MIPINRTLLLSAALAVAGQAQLAAQSWLFPSTTTFAFPGASPRAAGFVGRLINTSVSDNSLGPGTEADVRLGKILPVLALESGPQPLHLGFGVEVSTRFSLHDPKSSLLSNDWWVAVNLTRVWSRWEATAQLYHESSHLGDELLEVDSLTRLDWTRAALSGWLGRRMGNFKLSANVGYVLRDELELPPWSAALALDWKGSPFHLGPFPMRPVAGAFADGASQTDWRISWSGRVGLEFQGSGGPAFAISLVGYDGLSTQRQFFDQESRYLGMELRADF